MINFTYPVILEYVLAWESNNQLADYPWYNSEGLRQTVEIDNLQSINGVLRNTEMIPVGSETEYYRSYESGYIDLLNVHNVYLHCPN